MKAHKAGIRALAFGSTGHRFIFSAADDRQLLCTDIEVNRVRLSTVVCCCCCCFCFEFSFVVLRKIHTRPLSIEDRKFHQIEKRLCTRCPRKDLFCLFV